MNRRGQLDGFLPAQLPFDGNLIAPIASAATLALLSMV